VEQVIPDICRILERPQSERATTSLPALLTRLAKAFDADDACLYYQRPATLTQADISTSERARRLASSLLEGRWFAHQLDQGVPLILRRGAFDMPLEAGHERQCVSAAGVHAVIACAVTTEAGGSHYMTIFFRRPLTQWLAPSLGGLQAVSTAFARAALACPTSERPARTDATPSRAPVRGDTSSGVDHTIVGKSDALRNVMFRVDQVAPTNATALLLGETGTGKELIARAIHEQSPRRNRSFVVVNCGALPASLIESELFGRERGAFTDAHTSQPGRFELANGGTLFLDEIGELPLQLQPNLLRVLQEGQLQRLGSTRTTTVDVRVIAATNRDLAEEVQRGTFRRDLFYRLNVFPITLPPLRERKEDLPALVHHLVDRLSRQLGKAVSRIRPETLEALAEHNWPGNIRELENVLQQAIILSQDGVLELPGAAPPVRETSDGPPLPAVSLTLVDIERAHIRSVLASTSNRIEGPHGAAAALGLRPSTLRSLMHRLGIERTTRPALAQAG
jgi:transcriptional regulator with GAF, ATPase, and Fis domain